MPYDESELTHDAHWLPDTTTTLTPPVPTLPDYTETRTERVIRIITTCYVRLRMAI